MTAVEKQEQRKLKRSIRLWSAVAISVGAIIGGGIFVVIRHTRRLRRISISNIHDYRRSHRLHHCHKLCQTRRLAAGRRKRLRIWTPIDFAVFRFLGRLDVVSRQHIYWSRSGFGLWLLLDCSISKLARERVAAVLCLAFTGLNLVGAEESARVNNVLVAVKLAVLAFFVAFGVLHFNGANFLPFNPFTSGVLYGSFFIFFAYGGFARVTVVAEEVKDAKRNVPRALVISLGISMLVYVLVGS